MTEFLNYLQQVFVDQFNLWVVFGFIAQAMFTARFLVQWIASERARKSVVPVAFWLFSMVGGALLLAYAIHRRDPVFIIGQATGLLIYSRNLYLIGAERKRVVAEAQPVEVPQARR